MRRKNKFSRKFFPTLALASIFFSKGCSLLLPLPEYKTYEQPKKIILQSSSISKHLEDLVGRHKGQNCGGRVQLDSVATVIGEAKYGRNVASHADEKGHFTGLMSMARSSGQKGIKISMK